MTTDATTKQATTRKTVAESARWVIKIGSSLITDDGRGLNHQAIQAWAEQIAALRDSGKEILLVSSGAVAEGRSEERRVGKECRL